MNGVDSDLEEGEIIDDVPSPERPIRNKKLPRRYNIVQTKNNHSKHKKECRHTIRHHVKKLVKLKQSPVKTQTVKKNEHQSNILLKNYRNNFCLQTPPLKEVNTKITSYNPHALKDGMHKDSSQIGFNESKSESIADGNKLSKIREKYRALKNKKNSIGKVRFSNDLPLDNLKVSKQKNVYNGSKSPEVIEISDDEEDLRQMALATCAKQNAHIETSEILTQSLNCNNVPEVIKTNPSFSNYGNCIADNYDVVDMDLDDNNEASAENTDPLFIIDTMPSTSFQNNLNPSPKERKLVYCSDDDFEVDMLRAELIESMCSSERAKYDDEENKNVPKKNTSDVPTVTCKSPTVPENFKKEVGNIKPAVRSITEIETANSPKRLIISLNGESSTDDESDTEQDQNPAAAENPVASIEALISGIRQKSDSNDKSNNVEAVPKSVACLSKAQQEEYNALQRILKQKQKLYPLPQEIKSKFVHSPMDDLKVLEEKLMGVEEVLKSRKEKMTSLSKEVFTKKQIYMKAKLSAQHLKEQYILAEKTRRIKLDSWSKSCKNFEAMKKSVSELEGKISKLQNLCSRVGSCIQGKNYCLPSDNSES